MNLKLVREADQRIRGHIQETPVMTSSSLNTITGAEIFFKCENLQRGGAFKIRGAMNAVLSMSDEELSGGVCTHSSGNHAQALAIAAAERGVSALIVMPKNAPRAKREATAARGAKITLCEATAEDRERTLRKLQEETGAAFIHSYNDPRVIAGQGTVVLELRQSVTDLHSIVVPIGGGGLASGSCLSSGDVKVYAAEPEMADDAYRSLKTGTLLGPRPALTIADGLRMPLSERTFQILQEHLEEILLVSEEEILAAMRLLWERLKILVEPSGAASFAAVLRHKDVFAGKKVGIVITGGNVDLDAAALGRLFR
ncbi:MAG: serine dehydratase [Elusimicrobia bacterium]|nr:MAG: serine dehydratase [Elusimicrobiota bacterium]